MRAIKSEPKLKFSVSKYQNYFTEKNFNESLYMDDRAAQKPQLVTDTLQSYSSLTIQPKAKLSYSLHEKVGAVLSDSRRMGMIQKVQSSMTRKSLAKISYTSTLPPIKTEVQQTFEYLNKLKYQLNEVSLKCIKISNEVSNLQGQINITRQKSKVIKQILEKTGQKQQKEISSRNSLIEEVNYNLEVRAHMHQNLKIDNRALAKRKHALAEKLKTLKTELNSVTIQLDNHMASINNNIYTTKVYKQKQELTSEQIYMKSTIAQVKLTHERNAQKIHKKLQQIQSYDEDQYRYETNLKGHFEVLKQLRVQQVLNKFVTSQYHKYQTINLQSERCYSLIKMYANLSRQRRQENDRQKTNTKTKNSEALSDNNKSLIKSTNSLKLSISQQQQNEEIDIVMSYQNSFKTKSELEEKIKQKQDLIGQLEKKHQTLSRKWVQRFFNDNITNGSKVETKKIDYSKEIKKLIEKDKMIEDKKLVQISVGSWIKKQEDKLNFTFSKKMSGGQRIIKMLEYLCSEAKNIKQIPKYSVIVTNEEKKVKKKIVNKQKPK